MESLKDHISVKVLLPVLFVFARLIMLMGFSLDALKGYGDYWSYLPTARLGIPYIEIWVEYPPVFPFISRFILSITTSGHAYEYLLFILFSAVHAVNIYFFILIAKKLGFSEIKITLIGVCYTILSIGLSFTWWTFDVLCLLMILTSIYFFLCRKYRLSGVLVGAGILIKLFPILLMVLPFKYCSKRKVMDFIAAAVFLPAIIYGFLFIVSPEFTKASIVSQFAKGSWESIWALVDGNLTTGNFSNEINKNIPETAYLPTGNPAKIPPLLTLPFFLLVGFYSARKFSTDPRSSIAQFLGFTFCLFFLWSPGWSPQWTIYLLPFFFLGLPIQTAFLASTAFITINLLEWPVLLSRGRFDLLWLTIILRSFLLLLFGVVYYLSGRQLNPSVIHESRQTVEN